MNKEMKIVKTLHAESGDTIRFESPDKKIRIIFGGPGGGTIIPNTHEIQLTIEEAQVFRDELDAYIDNKIKGC